VLPEGLHWAGGEGPQRVVGQHDEHVHGPPLGQGPGDGQGAVRGAAGPLGRDETPSRAGERQGGGRGEAGERQKGRGRGEAGRFTRLESGDRGKANRRSLEAAVWFNG